MRSPFVLLKSNWFGFLKTALVIDQTDVIMQQSSLRVAKPTTPALFFLGGGWYGYT